MTVCNNKRILYLRADIGTQDLIGGGSVAHTLGVLKGFIGLGAHIVCASTAMHALMRNMPIRFLPLYVPKLIQRLSFKISCLVSHLLFYRMLKKCIRDELIEVIYQRYSMLNCLGVALAHRFKIPLYLEYNGSEEWVDKHWSPTRRLKIDWLIKKIELLNLRYATKIIVVSQVLKDQLLERAVAQEKIFVCPNGVDPDMFEAVGLLKQRNEKRAELALQDAFIIGFSGTFGPWHGVEMLASLIPRVVQHDERIHFLLIGDGPLKQKLHDTFMRCGVLHRVIFTGMIPRDAVPAYLAMCDAFVCPTQSNPDGTKFFGSPTKLFEYMIMGKPIIACDVEQIGAVLRQDAQNLLVSPDDLEGFARAVLDVSHMAQDERNQIGSRLRKRALEDYTWQKHVSMFM